jgi:LysM repeat protein
MEMAPDDHFTEPFQPYEPAVREETDVLGYDYDSGPDPDRPRGEVLWGRVGILGAIVLFAFVLGRCSGGGSDTGIAQSDLDAVKATLTEAQAEITDLQQQLNDALAANSSPAGDGEKGGNDNGNGTGNNGDGEVAAPTDVGPTSPYTIQSGDTFSTLAEKFYKNTAYSDWIAEANPDVDPGALQVGQVIQIPDNPPPQ